MATPILARMAHSVFVPWEAEDVETPQRLLTRLVHDLDARARLRR